MHKHSKRRFASRLLD